MFSRNVLTLIQHLVAVEEVEINIWDLEMESQVRQCLNEFEIPLQRVHFHLFPAYEPWCRDHGPIFLVRDSTGRHERAVIDWAYNAWGGKYPPFDLDDAIPQKVAQFRKLPLFSPGVVLEGGSIEVNGTGTLLTTESCLLNPNRNPQLDRDSIERYLKDYLGVTHLLWLNAGIAGDDTDGHIDDIARFVDRTTIVTSFEDDPADINYAPLHENWLRLQRMRDEQGRQFRVIKLPMPGVVEHAGQRLPASYANFYVANEIVLVPTYRHPNDAKAVTILQQGFPHRRVIGVDSTELIWGLGSFHCLTQQEPR